MKLTVVSHTHDPEKVIELAGRRCKDSRHLIHEFSYARFIRSLILAGHDSVLEHASITFDIDGVSRTLSHQLVRHRLASYSQRSGRYTKATFEFVMPKTIENNPCAKAQFESLIKEVEWRYSQMVNDIGIPKEDARFLIPQAECTDLTMTMNFRELRHFLKHRLAKAAQWEIRHLAELIRDEAFKIAPNVFLDFVEPAPNMPKGDV